MKLDRFQLTSKQLTFYILGATVATVIFSLPRIASKTSGPDAWLAVIIGGAAPLLSLLFIHSLWRRFPGMTFSQLSVAIFGRWIGSLLVLGYVVYLVLLYAMAMRNGIEITNLYMLPRTPLPVIGFLMMSAVIYIASQGIQVAARMNELLFYMLILSLLLLMVPVFQGDYTNLLPVAGTGLGGILKGALSTTFAYAGIEVLLVLHPMVTRQEEVIKNGLISVAISMGIYLYITVICLMVFGIEILQRVVYPGITLLNLQILPVIQRLNFLFLLIWMGIITRPTFSVLSVASYTLTDLLGRSLEKEYGGVVLCLGLLVFLIALYPENLMQANKYGDIFAYGFYIMGIGYPLFYRAAAWWRQMGGENVSA